MIGSLRTSTRAPTTSSCFAGARCALALLGLAALPMTGCREAPAVVTPTRAPARAPCPTEPCVRSEARKPRLARIEYEVSGRPFQLPIVRGSVGGVPTLFLVDTGANAHVVTRWLAKKAKLSLENHGDSSTDHVGKPVATFRTSHPSFVIDGWGPLPNQETIVIDVPEGLEKLGIGAFLSPQKLDASTIVLDLSRGELREGASLDEEKGALAEWATFSRPELRSLPEPTPCKDDTNPFGALSFVVPATLDDQRATLLVDTGAQRTDIFLGSNAGRALAARAEAGESLLLASGKIDTKVLRDTAVSVGNVRARLDVGVLPGASDTTCPREGVLAMDVLRRCVLVFGGGTFHGRCIGASNDQPEPAH